MHILTQTFASVALIFSGVGCSFTWTSPAMSKLSSDDPNVNPLGTPITPIQISMISGLLWVGSMAGNILSPHVLDRMGRKRTAVIFGLLQLMAYVLLAFSTNIILYYVARFLMGVSVGVFLPCTTMYGAEVTESHNRGKYIVMIHIFSPLGSVYTYILGVFFSVKIYTLLCTIPNVIGVIILQFFGAEAPIHLVEKGYKDRAIETLKKLRGREDIQSDIADIDSYLHRDRSDNISIFQILKEPAIVKAFQISCGLAILQPFSGVVAIMAFLGPMFDAAHIAISGNLVAIIVGCLKVSCFSFTSYLVEKLGRRTLMLISTSSASVTLCLLGIYFQLKDTDIPALKYLSWLPLICILTYIIGYSLGMGGVSSVIIGEILPHHIKSKALAIIGLFGTTSLILITFGFPIIKEFVGIPLCFYIFSVSCFLGMIFIYKILPETKHKTLLEIQEILAGEKKPDDC